MDWKEATEYKNICSIRKLLTTYELEVSHINLTVKINIWEDSRGYFYGYTNYLFKKPKDGDYYRNENPSSSTEEALQMAIWGIADTISLPAEEIMYEEADFY